ncbi:MAG: aspartyl protease family protein, partial [Verrucomicrobia bacterium]|nr:aspartyl protease family protein [Verrucomicrobiota bacterium]
MFTALCQAGAQAQAVAATEFPFQFRDGFIWVEVAPARTGPPLNFLLDTGASVSVLDQRVVGRLGLKLAERVRVTGVQTSVTGHWPQRVALKLGDVALPRDLLALDLTKLGRACATPMDGLVGADFFRGKAVQIDFAARVVRLLTPEQARRVEGESVALDIRSCGMRVPVGVNGQKPQWLRLDTGCAAPLHWVTASVEPKLCRRQIAVGLAELSLPTATVT